MAQDEEFEPTEAEEVVNLLARRVGDAIAEDNAL